MGPESNSGPVGAYLDGQPVEIGRSLPEITPGHSPGKWVTAAAAAAAAEGLRAFFYSMELALAVYLARIFKPELAHRYLHTKKKRTREEIAGHFKGKDTRTWS